MFGLGLGAGAFGEETAVLELDPDRVVSGRNTTIRVRTSIPWTAGTVISRPKLTGKLVWWAYPYARPWSIRRADGGYSRMIEVLGAVRVDEPGFHGIGSFQVQAGGRTVSTLPAAVIGLQPDEANFPYPVVAAWRPIPPTIWQGQSVPLILEARNLTSLALSESISLERAPVGLLEETPGFGGIITRPHGRDILYDVPMASWIWTPDKPGVQYFPGVRVAVNGLQRGSGGFSLQVKPLPEGATESGAVGRFRLDLETDEGPFRVGDIVSVRVRVEGEGNMSVLRPPEPALSGAELVSRGSSSSYLPSAAGYEGWREERYDFRIDRAGSRRLEVPEWFWFEPRGTGRVVRSAPSARFLVAEEALGKTEAGSAELMLGGEMFRYRSAGFHAKNAYWYLLLLPGVLTLGILIILPRPGLRIGAAAMVLPLLISAAGIVPEAVGKAQEAKTKALAGNWDAADAALESLRIEQGEFPGLLHDMALVRMKIKKPDDAVTLMRKAMHLRPGSRRLKNTLEHIEDTLGLTDQTPVPLAWPPSVVFAVWLAAVNCIFLAVSLLIFRRGGREMILLASVLILGFLAGIAVAYTGNRWNKSVAVVNENSQPLRKIPGPLATDWIRLPAGSAVSVAAVEGGDCLVLTGYGLEGWLPVSSLSFPTEVPDGL